MTPPDSACALLISVASAIPFEVSFRRGIRWAGACKWYQSKVRVEVPRFQNSPEECQIVLAHELGHLISFQNPNNIPKESSQVLQAEWLAWEIATDLLLDIGFSNWLLFNSIMLKCIKTYEKWGTKHE